MYSGVYTGLKFNTMTSQTYTDMENPFLMARDVSPLQCDQSILNWQVDRKSFHTRTQGELRHLGVSARLYQNDHLVSLVPGTTGRPKTRYKFNPNPRFHLQVVSPASTLCSKRNIALNPEFWYLSWVCVSAIFSSFWWIHYTRVFFFSSRSWNNSALIY